MLTEKIRTDFEQKYGYSLEQAQTQYELSTSRDSDKSMAKIVKANLRILDRLCY